MKKHLEVVPLSLGTIGIWGQMVLCGWRTVLRVVGYLITFLVSVHWMPVAPASLVVINRNIPRCHQLYPMGKVALVENNCLKDLW